MARTQRTCCGKVAYDDEDQAETAMREVLINMADAHPARKRPRRTYECPDSRWHFSSWPPYSDQEARERGAACLPGGGTVAAVAQRAAMERDGHHCVLCYNAEGLKVWTRGEMVAVLEHIPHRAERSLIRRTSLSNLITLCPLCERFRSDRWYRSLCLRTGLILDREQDPVSTPIHWNRHWVCLGDDGTAVRWGQGQARLAEG